MCAKVIKEKGSMFSFSNSSKGISWKSDVTEKNRKKFKFLEDGIRDTKMSGSDSPFLQKSALKYNLRSYSSYSINKSLSSGKANSSCLHVTSVKKCIQGKYSFFRNKRRFQIGGNISSRNNLLSDRDGWRNDSISELILLMEKCSMTSAFIQKSFTEDLSMKVRSTSKSISVNSSPKRKIPSTYRRPNLPLGGSFGNPSIRFEAIDHFLKSVHKKKHISLSRVTAALVKEICCIRSLQFRNSKISFISRDEKESERGPLSHDEDKSSNSYGGKNLLRLPDDSGEGKSAKIPSNGNKRFSNEVFAHKDRFATRQPHHSASLAKWKDKTSRETRIQCARSFDEPLELSEPEASDRGLCESPGSERDDVQVPRSVTRHHSKNKYWTRIGKSSHSYFVNDLYHDWDNKSVTKVQPLCLDNRECRCTELGGNMFNSSYNNLDENIQKVNSIEPKKCEFLNNCNQNNLLNCSHKCGKIHFNKEFSVHDTDEIGLVCLQINNDKENISSHTDRKRNKTEFMSLEGSNGFERDKISSTSCACNKSIFKSLAGDERESFQELSVNYLQSPKFENGYQHFVHRIMKGAPFKSTAAAKTMRDLYQLAYKIEKCKRILKDNKFRSVALNNAAEFNYMTLKSEHLTRDKKQSNFHPKQKFVYGKCFQFYKKNKLFQSLKYALNIEKFFLIVSSVRQVSNAVFKETFAVQIMPQLENIHFEQIEFSHLPGAKRKSKSGLEHSKLKRCKLLDECIHWINTSKRLFSPPKSDLLKLKGNEKSSPVDPIDVEISAILNLLPPPVEDTPVASEPASRYDFVHPTQTVYYDLDGGDVFTIMPYVRIC